MLYWKSCYPTGRTVDVSAATLAPYALLRAIGGPETTLESSTVRTLPRFNPAKDA
jgi:hypothetical protein